MENFIFQNPVKLIMGKGMIARLGSSSNLVVLLLL